MKRRLLLVEDEPGLVVTLSDRFRSAGYEVDVATTGPAALEQALAEPYDLILLDIMLPGLSGLEVCRELRRGSVETPILMLTALGDVVDKVVGLRIGADDYLTKPFATVELLARVEALLRRSAGGPSRPHLPDTFSFGDVEIRFPEVEVLRNGRPVRLSPRMFELLRFFVAHRGKAVTRDELLDGVWGPGIAVSERTVDVHVAWLRQRIEPEPREPRYLLTVRGVGYKLVA